MNFPFDHIKELTGSQRRQLLERLQRDADFRRDYEAWQALSLAIREDQDRILGDREVLVLYALYTGGYARSLSASERNRLEEAMPVLDEAVRSRPGVADIVKRIQMDAELFVADYSGRFEEEARSGLTLVRDTAALDNRGAYADGRRQVPAYDRSTRGRSRILRLGWRAGAVAAAVIFVGILVFVGQRESSRTTVDVAAGDVREVSMADGSSVRLVGPASLSYVPSRTLVRPSRVVLAGDAYFDVTKGEVPFVVETSTARVAVVGTNFGVRSLRDVTEVVLVSGRLSLFGMTDDRGLILEPGFASSVPRGGSPSEPEVVDLANALSWAGLFVFRGTSMSEITRILSDHYETPVTVEPRFATERFSGTFDRDRDLEDILDVIATALGARVVPLDAGFMLTGAGH